MKHDSECNSAGGSMKDRGDAGGDGKQRWKGEASTLRSMAKLLCYCFLGFLLGTSIMVVFEFEGARDSIAENARYVDASLNFDTFSLGSSHDELNMDDHQRESFKRKVSSQSRHVDKSHKSPEYMATAAKINSKRVVNPGLGGKKQHRSGIQTDDMDPDAKLVKTAHMDLLIEDKYFKFAPNRIEQTILSVGGSESYIQSSEIMQSSLHMTLRVPMKSFEIVLRELQGLVGSSNATLGSFGEVRDVSRQVEDVTEEYVDRSARKRALEATHEQLRTLLESAKNVSEILLVHKELKKVSEEIESQSARLSSLERKSAMSIIDLTAYSKHTPRQPQPKKQLSWGAKVWRAILHAARRPAHDAFVVWESLFFGIIKALVWLVLIGLPLYLVISKSPLYLVVRPAFLHSRAAVVMVFASLIKVFKHGVAAAEANNKTCEPQDSSTSYSHVHRTEKSSDSHENPANPTANLKPNEP